MSKRCPGRNPACRWKLRKHMRKGRSTEKGGGRRAE
jgi:hypothetical protein